jgi:hypothetical protein
MYEIKEVVSRIRTELILFVVMAVAVMFIPPEARMGLLGLFITKVMFVTMGVLYAHASRKLLFPYLDLKVLIEAPLPAGVAFLTVYYGVIIWAFAVGG